MAKVKLTSKVDPRTVIYAETHPNDCDYLGTNYVNVQIPGRFNDGKYAGGSGSIYDNGNETFWRTDWDVEYLPEPIVIPRQRYAVVIVQHSPGLGTTSLIRAQYGQWRGPWSERILTDAEVTEMANAHPEKYRVVFEGEDNND